MVQTDDMFYKRERHERKPWREFLAVTSSNERLPPRICCQVCAVLLAVLAVSVISGLLYVFTISHLQSRHDVEHNCDLRCALHAAKWANLTNVDKMEVQEQTPVLALDALSRKYASKYGDAFMVKHINSKMRQQQADAQRVEKRIGELTQRIASIKSLPTFQLLQEHNQKELRHLTEQVSASGHVIDLLQAGMTWDEAQDKVDAAAHVDSNKICERVLRELASDCDEPGIIPSFFRAVKPSQHIALNPTAVPTWPLLPTYPGLQTLNQESSIHIIDGFLTDHEVDALLNNAAWSQKESAAERREPTLSTDEEFHALAAAALVERDSNASRKSAQPPKKIKKRMKIGGTLIELDVHASDMPHQSRHCQPSGFAEDPKEWLKTLAPFFEAHGSDLKTCQEKKAFIKSDVHTLVCPTQSMLVNQVRGKITRLVQGRARHLEPLKVLHYREGDADADHWDSPGLDGEAHAAKLLTIMVYLSDVENGGSTYFPNLDLRVDPKRGRALVFPPLSMDLQVMAGTLHAEEEVKKGDKWVLTTDLTLGIDKMNDDPCE
mmetsp:Transcript_82022/g.145325  ORF Transcript_82022/g.145325 Transcript_82022/m.145325 type:complete len:549 (-) Transcript_82022:34-1680(-)